MLDIFTYIFKQKILSGDQMKNKSIKIEASCENYQEGLSAVVTEMHSMDTIL